jgi:acetyl-CoA C-acetyltransferase
MTEGIKNRVAIIGMGCSKFGERWEASAEDLMIEAFVECLRDAGIEKREIKAVYLGSHLDEINIGKGTLAPATTLKLPYIPVTRCENYCATATEAFRAACYAVAAGVHPIVLAIGVEKLKDTGYGGLPGSSAMGVMVSSIGPNATAPGEFALLANAYASKYGLAVEKVKDAMAHVSAKSHANGALNPKAHLRKPITVAEVKAAPIIAHPLGLYDCCGVSDGAACAIVTTPEIARTLKGDAFVAVRALQVAVTSGEESMFSSWDGAGIVPTQVAARRAYTEAGITNPREEISLMEVHDCFSITELVTMEDLQISPRGGAYDDIMAGFFDLSGRVPCQVDGGLKCFGHPIGASGLRMLYAVYEQLLERVPEPRRVKNARLGLTHNLGGMPQSCVVSVAVVGRSDA